MRFRGGWTAAVLGLCVLATTALATPEGDRLYQAALAKYNAKDYRGAITDAEAAASADPAHWQAWQLDGNSRYAIGDSAGALTAYRYSLRINPNNPSLKAFVDAQTPAAATPAPVQPAAQPATTTPAATTPTASQPSVARPSVSAEEPRGLRVSVYGGYGMVSLKELVGVFHGMYDERVADLKAAGNTASATYGKPSGGITAGLEATRTLGDLPLGYGVRGEVLLLDDVTSSYSGSTPSGSYRETDEYALGFSVIRIYAGGWARATTLGPLRLRADLWAGWTLLSIDWMNHWTQTYESFPAFNEDQTGKMRLTGAGPAATVELELAWPLSKRFELFLKAGYTYCKVPTALADQNYDLDGDGDVDAVAGEVLVDDDDKPIPYDLSGAGGRLGVQYFF